MEQESEGVDRGDRLAVYLLQKEQQRQTSCLHGRKERGLRDRTTREGKWRREESVGCQRAAPPAFIFQGHRTTPRAQAVTPRDRGRARWLLRRPRAGSQWKILTFCLRGTVATQRAETHKRGALGTRTTETCLIGIQRVRSAAVMRHGAGLP